MQADVMQEVLTVLRRYSPVAEAQSLDRSTRLSEDLGLNSGKVVEALLDLEDRFDIRLDASRLVRSGTVGGMADLVQAALGER